MKPTVCKFTVTGYAEFPIDMLRHDSAFPFDQASATTISRSMYPENRNAQQRDRKPFAVTLMAISRDGLHMPDDSLWRSFGWAVEPTSVSGGTL